MTISGAHRVGASLACAACLLTSSARAQPSPDPAGDAALQRETYLDRTSTANAILGSWAAASIGTGALMLAFSDDEFVHGMAIQHVLWGGIDALIVGISSIVAQQHRKEPAEAATWLERRETAETVFWVNAAIDLAYIATGGALWLFSDDADWQGAGAGVVMQGTFLLGFDAGAGLMMGADP